MFFLIEDKNSLFSERQANCPSYVNAEFIPNYDRLWKSFSHRRSICMTPECLHPSYRCSFLRVVQFLMLSEFSHFLIYHFDRLKLRILQPRFPTFRFTSDFTVITNSVLSFLWITGGKSLLTLVSSSRFLQLSTLLVLYFLSKG